MTHDLEDVLARAKLARRDELRRLLALVASRVAHGADWVCAPTSPAWLPVAERVGPEDRPGC